MRLFNSDSIVAVLLLAFCGIMWNATYAIEVTTYQSMQPSVWPRVILVGLVLSSACLLVRGAAAPATGSSGDARRPAGWLHRYRNALFVYAVFLGFLLTLDVLGMLIGGTLFVFLALTLLGQPSLSRVPAHLVTAVVSIGAMWAIFTFGLRVILPEGEILLLY